VAGERGSPDTWRDPRGFALKFYGLAAVAEQTPPERRGEVSSTYFVVGYVAIALPVIGEGLAAEAWGLRTAGIAFASAVSVLAVMCLAAILVEEARTRR
jgi:Catalase